MWLIIPRWHQDVKPSSILVFGKDTNSAYNCTFKLADLGFSHFKKASLKECKARDTDSIGTQTYGKHCMVVCISSNNGLNRGTGML